MAILALAVFLLVTSTGTAVRVDPFGRSSLSLSDLLNGKRGSTTSEAPWTGRYFPMAPDTSTTLSPLIAHGGVPMGALNPNCDDGKTNLTVDWDYSVFQYLCLYQRQGFEPNFNVQPLLEIENVPKAYSAVHYCMNETIAYLHATPTFGPHRPAWPRYGEYKFVPVQRWLHSLEHGAVVMLYHPCANHLEVDRLRHIVKSCLFHHVISPSRHLTAERPLMLLTWGKRLSMSAVDYEIVKDFIKQNALQGPEKISRDGQYDAQLIKAADIVSDTEDTYLCPDEKPLM